MTSAVTEKERASLDAQVLAWMREPFTLERSDDRFESLALALFAFQFDSGGPYRRFCEARGATPASISSWREIPAVPTGAFKEVSLRCFPADREIKTFRTSGTSEAGAGNRGELHLDTLALYEASLLPTIRCLLFPDLAPSDRHLIRVLAPTPLDVPDSSLSHMFGCLVEHVGVAGSGFDVSDDALQVEAITQTLERACESGTPIALCGTAFAFVHLLGALEAHTKLVLPAGSRVMETGGFKGKVREMPRDALYPRIEQQLSVPPTRIVNQYGMTELGSQFYDSVLTFPEEPRRKLGPPWARVRIVDPETGTDANPGTPGMIAVHDLANTGSVAAILTADLGRSIDVANGQSGFEVLGRHPEAEARGCSIAADLMLEA